MNKSSGKFIGFNDYDYFNKPFLKHGKFVIEFDFEKRSPVQVFDIVSAETLLNLSGDITLCVMQKVRPVELSIHEILNEYKKRDGCVLIMK